MLVSEEELNEIRYFYETPEFEGESHYKRWETIKLMAEHYCNNNELNFLTLNLIC